LHSLLSSSIFVEDIAFVNLFQQLDIHAEQILNNREGNNKPLVVTAESGVGKSAALATWAARRKANVPPARRLDYTEYVFWHAIGCSRLSTQVTHLLRRLVNELIVHFELKGAMDLADEKLPWILPRLLERAAKRGRVVIVIDGLQHICSNDKDYGLKWLPLSLPQNVRMILSATTPNVDSDNIKESTDHTRRLQAKVQHTWDEIKRRKWIILPLECLQNTTCVVNFIQVYLSQFPCQEIPLGQRKLNEVIPAHPLATNPMFLNYVLRGICHADSLGYNVNQCLVSWMPCRTVAELIHHMLSLFESGMPRKSYLGLNRECRLGPMLGQSLSLLFVARHGLHEDELFELLGRVKQQSNWNTQTEGTVVPVKLKILQMLMQKKNRLIDIFRSFDTDGNGTLSHDEFYSGMERLDINVSHDEVTLLINEVDNNGDGEIDYRETLDHFEHLARQYAHGKRRVSVFVKNAATKEDLTFTNEFKKTLISTLVCVGVSCLRVENGSVLTLPFQNIALRDTVWSRYINTAVENNEAKSRSFIIEFFSRKEPSLRYCEELPWHLKKVRSFMELKKHLVDLRTLDIMYSSSELKAELFNYLRILSIGGKIKFDIVREYNRSMQKWCQNSNPPSNQISRMSHFVADVMAWFSKNISSLTRLPPFMRESLEDECLRSIGIDLPLGRERGDSAGPRMLQNRTPNQMQPEAQYFFNRWVWIQFPWLALKNASTVGQKNVCRPNDQSNILRDESTPSTPERSISVRDKAMISAGVAEPSPTLVKLDKMESLEPRRKNSTVIPFSAGTSWESKKDLRARKSSDESSYEYAAKQLRELKHIHDTITVEAESKERHLNELESVSKSRQVGDTKSHRRIVDGEKSLKEFQSRLEQLDCLMETASSVDIVYQDILIALHHCDPANQYHHIQLEQQIVLCKQQITDLQREGSVITKEIEKVEARSNGVSLDARAIAQERQRIKPNLESLRTRLNEESERRKTARVTTFDPQAFSRRVRLEGRIAKRRQNKLKRNQSICVSSSAEITKAAKLHPMERLAQASGTRDPMSIQEILKEDETQRLRTRQERGELHLKEQVETIDSLENQIKELTFADSAVKIRPANEIDKDVANAEAELATKQKRLDQISQLVRSISFTILNLSGMLQSVQEDKALREFACFAMKAVDRAKLDQDISLIKSLCEEIPSEIEPVAKKKEHSGQEQAKYTNVRIMNRAEQESCWSAETTGSGEEGDEDSEQETEEDSDEDFGKLASYVNNGIQTDASRNEQRRANILSQAKQGKYASKGIVLEAVLLSASKDLFRSTSKDASP